MQQKINFTTKVEDVTDELILRRCANPQDAIKLCRDCSPLDDKQIVEEIKKLSGHEFQRSHFSEYVNGNRAFPPKFIQVLEDVCENLIVTRYMALSRNQDLRPKKEAWEIENDQLRQQLADTEKQLEIIRNWEKNKNGSR